MGLTLDLHPTPIADEAPWESKELRQIHQALIAEQSRQRNIPFEKRLSTLS